MERLVRSKVIRRTHSATQTKSEGEQGPAVTTWYSVICSRTGFPWLPVMVLWALLWAQPAESTALLACAESTAKMRSSCCATQFQMSMPAFAGDLVSGAASE